MLIAVIYFVFAFYFNSLASIPSSSLFGLISDLLLGHEGALVGHDHVVVGVLCLRTGALVITVLRLVRLKQFVVVPTDLLRGGDWVWVLPFRDRCERFQLLLEGLLVLLGGAHSKGVLGGHRLITDQNHYLRYVIIRSSILECKQENALLYVSLQKPL